MQSAVLIHHLRYAGTFLGAMGIYPTIPNNLSWAANNVEGSYKRGVLLGIVVGAGNINGECFSNNAKNISKRYL